MSIHAYNCENCQQPKGVLRPVRQTASKENYNLARRSGLTWQVQYTKPHDQEAWFYREDISNPSAPEASTINLPQPIAQKERWGLKNVDDVAVVIEAMHIARNEQVAFIWNIGISCREESLLYFVQ